MANWLGHKLFGTTADLIEVTPDKRVDWKVFGGDRIRTISSALILDGLAFQNGAPLALH